MTTITELGVAAIREGVAKGEFSAVEAAEAFNANVAAAQGALNAFIVATPEKALEAARKVDADRASGKPLGKLAGVPIGMKDLFATRGVQTTAASHILEGFTPEYESTVSQKLWDAGAGMLGKLNLDQFAMGSSNETSYFGNVISPWRRNDGGNAALAPGGSSGGSSRGRRRAAVPGGDRHRHRRLDPPARRVHRHLRHQADLRPLLALGRRRFRLARSTRPGRWRATCATARSCSKPWPGSIPRIRPASICRCPTGKPALSGDLAGKKVGIPREYRMDGMDAEVAEELGTGRRLAQGRGGRDRRDLAAAHQVRAAGLLYHRPGRSLVQSRAL